MATRISPMAYLKNLKKEGGQALDAYLKASDASAGIGPGANEKAARANKKQRAEQGQFLGALLQGRRYDRKGNQI